MRSQTYNCSRKITGGITGALFASLFTLDANAASCPCDPTSIPLSAWSMDSSAHTFDKVSIDTGVMCTDKIEVGEYSSGGFSIFKRFVGISAGKKSQALAEVRLAMISSGTRCIVQTENTGLFATTPNVQQREERLSKGEFAACVTAANNYARQLNIECEKKPYRQ